MYWVTSSISAVSSKYIIKIYHQIYHQTYHPCIELQVLCCIIIIRTDSITNIISRSSCDNDDYVDQLLKNLLYSLILAVRLNCTHFSTLLECFCYPTLCAFYSKDSKNVWDAKSHWLQLFHFSLLCVFICVLKPLAQKDVYSHWLHLLVFSPLCMFKWFLKALA